MHLEFGSLLSDTGIPDTISICVVTPVPDAEKKLKGRCIMSLCASQYFNFSYLTSINSANLSS